MFNGKTIVRGVPSKRGYQHHGFIGKRCSNVNAAQVLAALRAGYRVPINQITSLKHQASYVKLREPDDFITDQTDKFDGWKEIYFDVETISRF